MILMRVIGVHITLISSLDALCRQQACQDAAAANPGTVVVLHDLLENGVVIRRISSQSGLVERAETQLEHGRPRPSSGSLRPCPRRPRSAPCGVAFPTR
ncbi:hypothetical protein AHiyo4_40950 [Arthrobacter sp. Hiyo4]|nr:hypothetical protein AHiyo4_40950 [Arthrobacter sp. Hiyo4]